MSTAGPRRHRIRGDGVTIAAEEHGDRERPTILLVHGFPDSQGLWSLVVERLRDRFHVLTYDVRGAGESGVPSGRRPYAMERLVADAAAVLDALAGDGRRVHVVGHDWGAIQGWEFLYAEPTASRIASFTSFGGACFDHVGVLTRERLRHPTPTSVWRVVDQLRRSWYMLLFQLPAVFRAVWVPLLAPRWGWLLAHREGIARGPDFPAATVASDGANLVGLYWRTPGERMLRPRRIGTIQVPVQVLRAERDRFLAPHTLDGVERFLAEPTVGTLPGGHWSPRVCPERLAELIAEHVHRADGRT